MSLDVMTAVDWIIYVFNLIRGCKAARNLCGIVLPEKCGKTSLCSALGSKRVVLVDLDELLKTTNDNSNKLNQLKYKNDYDTLTLLLIDETAKLLVQLKRLHRFKRIVLLTSNKELMSGLRIPFKMFVPSNQLLDTVKSTLNSDDKKILENSRNLLIQSNTDVFNTFEDLNHAVSDLFDLKRKL